MNLFGKKAGFSLMEIIIAVLIVAILALAVTPIVGRQMQKSKEYSYYLAYRTLEKMAGQIIMQGEPQSGTSAYNNSEPSFMDSLIADINYYLNPLKRFANKLGAKWAYTEGKLFSKLFSKSNAAGDRRVLINSFTSDEFDELVLCASACSSGREKVPKGINYSLWRNDYSHREGSDYYKTFFDINSMCDCDSINIRPLKKNSLIVDFLFGEDADLDAYDNGRILDLFETEIKKDFYSGINSRIPDSNKVINAETFCKNYKDYYTLNDSSRFNIVRTESGYRNKIGDNGSPLETPGPYCARGEGNLDLESEYCYWNMQKTQHPGTCVLYASVNNNADNTFVLPSVEYDMGWCTSHGYIGFKNIGAPSSIDCQPSDGYAVSENNEKVAFEKCTGAGERLYAKHIEGNNYERVCSTQDFNESKQELCGERAVYNGGENCDCVAGWQKGNDGMCNVKAPCPVGTHENNEGLCVANPPIITGKAFCELIKKHWNIQDDPNSDSCDTFAPKDNTITAHLYDEVYTAVTKDGKYMSLDANEGAFNAVSPNIRLGNGLKLWILGDKAASIPGLSFFNSDSHIKPHQNMCILNSSLSQSNCSTVEQNYFCNFDKNCYGLHDDSSIANIDDPTVRKNLLLDARGCCSAHEFGELIAKASGSDARFKQEPTVYAVPGFTVFVDIDGDKGSGTLWDDVFPFYIAVDGRVYPGYPLDASKADGSETPNSLYIAGNSEQMLPTDVYYYDAGKRVTAFPGVSYARAVCSARVVSKHTPYCMNLGDKFRAKGTDGNPLGSDYISDDNKDNSKNPCDHNKCYVSVRNKLRYF